MESGLRGPARAELSHVAGRTQRIMVGRPEAAHTGKTVICVLLRLQDVEEGVKKAIVFLCLQARAVSAWDASRGAQMDSWGHKGQCDRWSNAAVPGATTMSRPGSWTARACVRGGMRVVPV